MSTTSAGSLTGYLRHVMRSWQHDGRTDAELLTTFIQHKDDQAFTTLVGRYGLLVWKACRRNLRTQQDAEDAFQATFLVLAKKAAQLLPKERVGPWLYGVARRTAANLRKSLLRRRRHEQQVLDMPTIDCSKERNDNELLAILEDQIERLPRHYREVLVLCRLGGKTNVEVARELGCSEGTIRQRVAYAEQLLRERLSSRGLALSGAALTALLSQATTVSAMPTWLWNETARAALAFINNTLAPSRARWLAQGVLQQMGNSKVMLWGGLLLGILLCLGGTGFALVAIPLAQAAGEKRLDRWGDPLPEGALARIGTLRFRPDRWRDQYDGAFLPDCKTLVSVHKTNTVHFWDVATGKELRRLQIQGLEEIRHVRVSADGARLAVVGPPEVQVWDLTADPPQPCWTLKAQGRFAGMDFSPDGKTLACSDVDPWVLTIYLLDANTGEQRQTLELDSAREVSERVRDCLAFSPDGKYLAEWHWLGGRAVYLWEVASGKRWHTNHPYDSFCGFSPDSRTMATRQGGQIDLWEVATGKQKRSILHTGAPFVSALFLPNGTLLEGDGVHLRLWDPDTGKQRRPQLEAPGFAPGWLVDVPALSPDGKLLAAVSNNMIRVWQVETGQAVGPEGLPGPVREVAFSPDGDSLATRSGDLFSGISRIQMWQAHTGAQCPRLKLDSSRQLPSLDTEMGLYYGRDHWLYTYRIPRTDMQRCRSLVGWDTQTGKALDVPPGIQQAFENRWDGWAKAPKNGWAVAPDGRFLALGYQDSIALYDLATGKEVRRFRVKIPTLTYCHLVFSTDGLSLAGYLRTREGDVIEVWDVATGNLRQHLQPGTTGSGDTCLAQSPDGRWLALYERQPYGQPRPCVVQLWEVASGKAGPSLQAGRERIFSLAFAPDGRTLAAGCEEGGILLWDLRTGQKRHAFHGHRGLVHALAFSPDGLRLASGSADTTALVWDLRSLPPADPVAP